MFDYFDLHLDLEIYYYGVFGASFVEGHVSLTIRAEGIYS